MTAACRGIDFGRAGCYNPLYKWAWRPRGGPERRTADSFCIKAQGSAVSFCLRWYGVALGLENASRGAVAGAWSGCQKNMRGWCGAETREGAQDHALGIEKERGLYESAAGE